MWASEVTTPGIIVRVELDERYGAEFLVDRTQDGKQDGMIAADTERTGPGCENVIQLARDSFKGIVQRKGIDREVAVVGHAPFRKGIDIQDGVPGANHATLRTDIARSKARSRTIGRSAIVGNAD